MKQSADDGAKAASEASRTGRVVLAAGLTLLLWASVYSALKVSLQGFSIWQLAFLRMAAASVALGVYAAIMRVQFPARQHWPSLILIGFIGFAVYSVLLNLGQRTVEAGTASFIINITPALSALLAVAFLKERLRALGFLGIAISFSGVALIVAGGGHGLQFDFSPGAAILLVAALAHAAHFVLQKATLHAVSPFQVTVVSVWAGTAFLLPFGPDTVAAFADAPADAVAAAIYLGVFPSAVAYVTWAYVMAYMPAAIATSLLALIPPLAVIIGAVWLGELPTLLAFCGGALSIAGVILVQSKGRPP